MPNVPVSDIPGAVAQSARLGDFPSAVSSPGLNSVFELKFSDSTVKTSPRINAIFFDTCNIFQTY